MSPPVTSADYAAAIEYLYSRINYERTPLGHFRPPKLGLERMSLLLDRLGNPQLQLPVVHIAGTKGKGSTATMISSILAAAGYRTGLYTSPHLACLEERYVVNGSPCSRSELTALTETLRPIVAEVDQEIQRSTPHDSLTFFEITTAMVWLHFLAAKADIAVLEVGMGGRLDSTNLCQPAVCVITSISFDHMKQLGNTLAAIAREKAGIIKPGKPVISGVDHPEAQSVIAETAVRQRAPLYTLGVDFGVHYGSDAGMGTPWFDYHERMDGRERFLGRVQLGLIGRHQAMNGGVALAVAGQLDRLGWKISEEAMRQGMLQARCAARIEVVRRDPVVIVDAGHNVASIAALVQTLNESFPQGRRLLVFAASRDKDVRGMLWQVLPHFDEIVLTQYVENPRAVPVEELSRMVEEIRSSADSGQRPQVVSEFETPATAWQYCRSRSYDLACITGSFFLAAELRPIVGADG